jgi:hypothetical protein
MEEREKKAQLEQARKDYQARVIAQMKVQAKRDEQENKQLANQEENRIRKQRQDEISRRIQEEHIRKKMEKEQQKA